MECNLRLYNIRASDGWVCDSLHCDRRRNTSDTCQNWSISDSDSGSQQSDILCRCYILPGNRLRRKQTNRINMMVSSNIISQDLFLQWWNYVYSLWFKIIEPIQCRWLNVNAYIRYYAPKNRQQFSSSSYKYNAGRTLVANGESIFLCIFWQNMGQLADVFSWVSFC